MCSAINSINVSRTATVAEFIGASLGQQMLAGRLMIGSTILRIFGSNASFHCTIADEGRIVQALPECAISKSDGNESISATMFSSMVVCKEKLFRSKQTCSCVLMLLKLSCHQFPQTRICKQT
ncbi:hypothetical protein [Caballeronia zhejiangensis]|uniref:hypothetical protein n=1 Tax=Caballeronia zhejiangensis TaxID=871203 RepID=UPI0013641610|nr:hypothetical protein [Caballeronia zhejiangensis]